MRPGGQSQKTRVEEGQTNMQKLNAITARKRVISRDFAENSNKTKRKAKDRRKITTVMMSKQMLPVSSTLSMMMILSILQPMRQVG